jgi:hypothetical protein
MSTFAGNHEAYPVATALSVASLHQLLLHLHATDVFVPVVCVPACSPANAPARLSWIDVLLSDDAAIHAAAADVAPVAGLPTLKMGAVVVAACSLLVRQLCSAVDPVASPAAAAARHSEFDESVWDSFIDFGASSPASSTGAADAPCWFDRPALARRCPELHRLVVFLDGHSLANFVPHRPPSAPAAAAAAAVPDVMKRGTILKKNTEVDLMRGLLHGIISRAGNRDGREPILLDIGAGQGQLAAAMCCDGVQTVAVERDEGQVHGSVKRAALLASKAAADAEGSAAKALVVCQLDVAATTTVEAAVAAANAALRGGADAPSAAADEVRGGKRGRAASDAAAQRFGMCSLHACGQLSNHMLGMFAGWATRGDAAPCDFVVNLGCCYNQLAHDGRRIADGAVVDACDEGLSSASVPADAFPRSSTVQQLLRTVATGGGGSAAPLTLSRNALMAACQAPRRWAAQHSDADGVGRGRAVFAPVVLRAAVQRLLFDHGVCDLKVVSALKSPKKLQPFVAYCAAAWEKVSLASPAAAQRNVSEERIRADAAALLTKFATRDVGFAVAGVRCATSPFDAAAALLTLKALLGQAVEALLIVDRAALLGEQTGATCDVGLVAVCDHVRVTPRNVAVVGVRRAARTE